MFKLASKIPARHLNNPGAAVATSDVDTGGYDVLVGGHGFRLATDQQMAYERGTEATTTHRYDSSLEPGEQSLSPLPWIKSQSSFHGGAGQTNLEQGFTAFQYQAEQVEHIRFDNCQGVDVWTPGQVKRLPDTAFYNFGFTSSCMTTATVNGIDYAVVGGNGGLYQLAWSSGPNSAPTVTAIDLSGASFGGASNCNVTSLATDGVNYYALIQLTTRKADNAATLVVQGVMNSASAPSVSYVAGVPSTPTRTNYCSNPNFEAGNTNFWSAYVAGASTTTLTAPSASGFQQDGTYCMKVASNSTAHPNGVQFTSGQAIANAQSWTASLYVNIPVALTQTVRLYIHSVDGSGVELQGGGHYDILAGTVTSGPTRISVNMFTSVSSGGPYYIQIQLFVLAAGGLNVGESFYVDDALIEQSSTLQPYFDGNTPATAQYQYAWSGTANQSVSNQSLIANLAQQGCLGWVKARLCAGLGTGFYELPPAANYSSALPQARYVNPTLGWLWSDIAESPTGVLASGSAGNRSAIHEFTLDTSGGTPFLSGGNTVAVLPPGEVIQNIETYLSSFLAIGTTAGLRVGTFDTYTGALKYGPLSVTTTAPVLGITGRDRFIYGSFTNQQANGKTGLFRLDLSMVIDAAGRNAYAPDLRPPTTAPTGLGAVTCVTILPQSNRLVFLTPEGIHVEGNGPGSDGDAWLRTSRIRYDTAEMKLFKLGRLHGSLDVANIQISGITPFGGSQNLGTFGFLPTGDPGEFRLPTGLNEWIQLQFDLQGSACVLNSYQVKALPAPKRQHIITLTVNCFINETDKYGLDVTDPEIPRQRFKNLQDLEAAGNEIRYVEFTTQGAVAELVVIDQLVFRSFSRPNITDDFGGYITIRLRTTET